MRFDKSKTIFNKAKEYIPGGVNSPVRAFGQVDINPVYIEKAKGAYVFDMDGNKFIDYVGSWGPLILGHADEDVVRVIHKAASRGTSYGACSPFEIEMASMIINYVQSIEMVRMVNSGTEACMSAVRLARAYTGRKKIIKFEGCYHGHSDAFLVKAGSGVLTLGIPGSAGVNENVVADTLIATFNNIDSVYTLFKEYKNEIAAIIIEPVMANAGLILPYQGFLHQLRDLCDENRTVLIFDEVITGFRLARGGAQEHFGIHADLTCLGKIIGGGLPVGAFGGKKEIMELLAPNGPVYQAGTLSGNPIALAAGIMTLKKISRNNFYEKLEEKAMKMEQGIKYILKKHHQDFAVNRIASMWTFFFKQGEVNNYNDAIQSNTQLYADYFKFMFLSGVYLAPSQFEAAFISEAHSMKDIDETLEHIDKYFFKAFHLLSK